MDLTELRHTHRQECACANPAGINFPHHYPLTASKRHGRIVPLRQGGPLTRPLVATAGDSLDGSIDIRPAADKRRSEPARKRGTRTCDHQPRALTREIAHLPRSGRLHLGPRAQGTRFQEAGPGWRPLAPTRSPAPPQPALAFPICLENSFDRRRYSCTERSFAVAQDDTTRPIFITRGAAPAAWLCWLGRSIGTSASISFGPPATPRLVASAQIGRVSQPPQPRSRPAGVASQTRVAAAHPFLGCCSYEGTPSHQSPVTSHSDQSPVPSHQPQSPVPSHQSPVTSHQSPVTSHQPPPTASPALVLTNR